MNYVDDDNADGTIDREYLFALNNYSIGLTLIIGISTEQQPPRLITGARTNVNQNKVENRVLSRTGKVLALIARLTFRRELSLHLFTSEKHKQTGKT